MHKRYVETAVFCLALILFSGCGSGNERSDGSIAANQISERAEVSVTNYKAYISAQQADLKVSREIGDFIYTVTYVPIELMALREAGTETLTEKELGKLMQELGDLQYFTFSISNRKRQGELLKYALPSEGDYQERINYFSFKMQDDIVLIDGADTLACELFHFERTYDVAPYLSFTMAFRQPSGRASKTISFNDMIFKNGMIHLTFEKEVFDNLPKIKIS